MSTIAITVKLFGAFHKYYPENNIILSMPVSCTLTDIRQTLLSKMQNSNCSENNCFTSAQKNSFPAELNDLLNCSAFANEIQVLNENISFQQDTLLAIIPPVCGG